MVYEINYHKDFAVATLGEEYGDDLRRYEKEAMMDDARTILDMLGKWAGGHDGVRSGQVNDNTGKMLVVAPVM